MIILTEGGRKYNGRGNRESLKEERKVKDKWGEKRGNKKVEGELEGRNCHGSRKLGREGDE